jgi:hypothetical protein
MHLSTRKFFKWCLRASVRLVYFHLALSYNSKQTYQLYTKVYGECKYLRFICFSRNSGDHAETGFVVVKTTALQCRLCSVCPLQCIYSRGSGTPYWQNNFLLVYSPVELPAWCLYTLYHVKIKNKNIILLRTSLLHEKLQIRQASSPKMIGIGPKSVNMLDFRNRHQ